MYNIYYAPGLIGAGFGIQPLCSCGAAVLLSSCYLWQNNVLLPHMRERKENVPSVKGSRRYEAPYQAVWEGKGISEKKLKDVSSAVAFLLQGKPQIPHVLVTEHIQSFNINTLNTCQTIFTTRKTFCYENASLLCMFKDNEVKLTLCCMCPMEEINVKWSYINKTELNWKVLFC